MNVAPHVMVIYTRGKVITNQLNFFSLNKLKFTNEMNTISIENYHIKGYFVFSLPVLQIQMGSTSIINVRLNFIVHSSKSKQIHNLNQFHHIFCCFFSSLLSQIFLGGEFQVCEENKCQEEVFILAMNYMDRFLASTPIPRTQLQMLASACLLIASKLREPSVRGLPAEILVFYTDNSVTRRDLIVSKYTNVKYFR